MSQPKRFKRALICSTTFIGGSLLNSTAALAVSCPSTITGSALAGIACDFDTGSSVTVASGGNVGDISMNAYFPISPSFILNNGTVTDTGNSFGLLINSSALLGGITNTGSISATTGTGIQIANTSTISGGITNSGTITALNDSIRIDHSTINGGITNTQTGHLSSTNGEAVTVTNSSTISGGITNQGTISTTGVFVGLVINNNTNITGGLLNTGTIQATGNGAGVMVRGTSSVSGGITNSGTISSTGNVGLTIFNVSNVTGNVTNSGTISGGTDGVSVHNAAVVNGNLQNSGTITGGDTGIKIYSATTITGAIQNSGTITGDNTGIAISSTATITGGITNSGTIQGSVFAISIDAGSNVSDINLLSGSRVIGAINAVNTDLNFNAGGTFQSEGSINVDAINVLGNFTALNSITVGSGVNVGSGGTLSLASTITGDLTAGTGGTFSISVGTGITSAITGTADFLQGSVAVDVQDAPLLQDGDNVFTANTLIAPASAVTDNSYLWNFTLNNAGTGYRAVRVAAASLGFNQADSSTYNTLQALAAANTSNPAMLQILGNLNSAGSSASAQSVLQSVEPTLNASDFVGAQTLNNQMLDIATGQLAMLRQGEYKVASLNDFAPAAGGGPGMKGVRAWGQLFGSHAAQSGRGGILGYSANTWGGVLGLDTQKMSDQAVLGMAFGYGSTDADSNNSNRTDTEAGSYQLTLYGNYALAQEMFITGMLSYGWQNVDTTRHNVGGTPGVTARGSFDTHQYGARAELGKNFAYGSAVVTPSFMANYLHYSPEGYTESGAGGANLTVDRKDMNVLEIGPRVTLTRAYQHDGGILTPSVHGGLRYDVIGDGFDTTNIFAAGGPAFDTQGIEPGRAALDLGASLRYQTAGNWEFSANYDFQYKSDYTSNAGFLRANYKF